MVIFSMLYWPKLDLNIYLAFFKVLATSTRFFFQSALNATILTHFEIKQKHSKSFDLVPILMHLILFFKVRNFS